MLCFLFDLEHSQKRWCKSNRLGLVYDVFSCNGTFCCFCRDIKNLDAGLTSIFFNFKKRAIINYFARLNYLFELYVRKVCSFFWNNFGLLISISGIGESVFTTCLTCWLVATKTAFGAVAETFFIRSLKFLFRL